MKKSILNFSYNKNSFGKFIRENNSLNMFFLISAKKFSGGHGHGHGAPVEEEYHERKYNRVSYNKKLSGPEREKIPFIDYMNEPDNVMLNPRRATILHERRYEVLAPFETRRDDMADSLMDRTEIQARIYNVLRQLDLKPLEEIDFDADYEKELGFDSLEWTAIVTSIEHEFHTAFEDSLFEHFRTINDFVGLIEKDFSCF